MNIQYLLGGLDVTIYSTSIMLALTGLRAASGMTKERLENSMKVFAYKSLQSQLTVQPYRLKPARHLCPWGFSRQESWSGLPCPPPGDLPKLGIEPRSPILQADSLLSEPLGKPWASIISVHQVQVFLCWYWFPEKFHLYTLWFSVSASPILGAAVCPVTPLLLLRSCVNFSVCSAFSPSRIEWFHTSFPFFIAKKY